jgi:outer membrane lipase/esterase
VLATSLAGTGTAPYFGGKWTTNTHTGYTAASNTSTANIWVEWIAARLGVPITPAEVGFATTRVPCPAQAQGLAFSCSGYAQGGSRVTDPNGIGRSSGSLTIPIVGQIASHNTRTVTGFQTGFTSGDIVFVYAGGNDVLVQAAAVGGGLLPATASTNLQTAATELATLVKNEILAKGATRVAVMTVPELAAFPYGATQGAQGRALLTQLVTDFNTALLAGLSGSAARIIDARALSAAVIAAPASFGLTNATTGACSPAKIAALTSNRVTNGSALFCNATAGAAFNGIATGASASTYLFADDIHPTTTGHRIFADQVWQALKDFGWVPVNL